MGAKRVIRIHRKNGTCQDMELSKATVIDSAEMAGMMHLDELKDGTWRLTFTPAFATDFSEIDKLEIIRS